MAEASSVVQMLAMSELISTVIQQEAERKAGSFCSLPNINITQILSLFAVSFIHPSSAAHSKDAEPNQQAEAAAELAFCRSPVQTGRLNSETGGSGFVSLLFCCVTSDVTLGAGLPGCALHNVHKLHPF